MLFAMRSIGVVAAGAMLIAGSAVGQVQLRLLNSWDNRYPGNYLVMDKFAAAIKDGTQGAVSIRTSGPEVVPAFEQFQPLAKGAFDMLFTTPPFHAGQTSVAFGLFTLEPDPEGWRKNGIFALMEKEYAERGVKLLAIPPGNMKGTGAFHVVLREPLTAANDLKGRKIRSTRGSLSPFTEGYGGISVQLVPTDIYGALQRGTVDGAAYPVLGTVDYKWYEVSKYMTRPTWGTVCHMLLMNTSAWDKLSDAHKKVIDEASRRAELDGMTLLNAKVIEEIDELKKRGMQEVQLDPARLPKIMGDYRDALWTLAGAHPPSAARAKEFRMLVRSLGQ